MARALPRTFAAVFLAAGVVHCSLIAPSDQDLMGGNVGSSGGSDAGDAGRSDATDAASDRGDGGACTPAAEFCNTTAECCSGFACDQNAGICVPCTPTGSSCFSGTSLCCSGNCTGHTCR